MPTKTARSFRLSDLAERQLAALAGHWGASLTETLTLCIDRAWRQESFAADPPAQAIQLIEDNAGHLFIGTEAGPWFAAIGTPGTFDDDATAITNGDTDDWTVEHFDERPQGETVAEWAEGALHAIVSPTSRQLVAGIAARRYMGLTTTRYPKRFE